MQRRTIIILGLALAMLLCLGLAVKSCSDARTAATRAKLEAKQSGAAIESGKDAVQTVGNTSAREAEIRDTVKDGTDEIQNATPGDSNAAAERATCRLRSYRHTSKCVALLGPAPK